MMAFQRHAQLAEVEVPLERVPLVESPERVAHQVDGHGASLFDVGLGGVEVRVVEDDVSRFEMQLHQDVFGGAPLVRGHDVSKPRDLLDRALQDVEALRPDVRLVPAHERRPLLRAHGAAAAVRSQVDVDVARRRGRRANSESARGCAGVLRGLGASAARRPWCDRAPRRWQQKAPGRNRSWAPRAGPPRKRSGVELVEERPAGIEQRIGASPQIRKRSATAHVRWRGPARPSRLRRRRYG